MNHKRLMMVNCLNLYPARTKQILLVLPFLTLCAVNPVFSQNPFEGKEINRRLPDEQLYVHTDREFYFLKETIWFKAYLLDRQTLQFTEGYENLFIDLVNEKGEIMLKVNLLSHNGQASGNLFLPDTIPQGTYTIRAYTAYLRNFGGEAFFSKPLKISRVMSSIDLADKTIGKREKPGLLPDISILPEGGFLLSNRPNLVAVKAVDQSGEGVRLKGVIYDEDGKVVASFKTDYRGMGSFYLLPYEGKSYNVEIQDYPELQLKLEGISNEGIKLHLIRQDSKEVVISVTTNSGRLENMDFYLASMFRGRLQFYKHFQPGGENRLFRISSNMFPGGINRLVLLDTGMKPVSERLLFSENYQINHMVIKTDSDSYRTRSEINLLINDEKELDADEVSNLSVAVVDENAVNADGPFADIRSYLLLGAELKGYFGSPADYFVSDSIDSKSKLDLLMLTNGWSNYFWNVLPEEDEPLVCQKEWGIYLTGRAEKLLGKKPVPNGEISLMIFKKEEIEFLNGKTDQNGIFNFGRFFIYDSASVFIQARNEKGGKFNEIFLDPVFENRPAVSQSLLSAGRNFTGIPMELYRQKYYNNLALREFHPDTSTIMLGEVEVKRTRKEQDDGHFRLYGTADNSIKVTDHDIGYRDVIDYLAGKVAGLMISGNSVSIRGMGMPLFMVDGIPFEGTYGLDMIRTIPMSDIDVVEVLKNVSNLALFGSRGANGVIAVYTKRGEAGIRNDYLIGAITSKIMGYQPYKKFYSPKYSPENMGTPEPDYRTTLFWAPEVVTENGTANLSFFSSDEVTRYRIFVEGITSKGKICMGTGEFLVNRFRNKPSDE